VGAGGSGVAVGAAVGATDTDETPQEIKSDVTSIKPKL
jgi:hypothetical protein